MKEERMMILKMIESGKITADEAVKLLGALSSSGKASEMLGTVKKKVSKLAKDAEPVVKAAAEKGMVIGSNVKKKVEKKINESKIKEKLDESGVTDKVNDVIDDVKDNIEDAVDDVKEVLDTDEVKETVDTDELQSEQ